MYRILALCCIIGLALGRQPDAPHHSSDHLPNTAFSCRDKVLGGYYADPDAQCQMFHVCVKVAGVGIQDFRFLCPNGTAFDQEAQICASWADVACEPAALYYSSDNFDLYRIGSGFESKKAPYVSEEEQDFHLQRAEPDILSGAHSSNFFNNREGKDIDDPKPKTQNKNQVDQSQKRKVVKKLQRRPVETTTSYTTTTQRVFTNNFAGSFVPTTSRPPVTSTFASSSQAPQYNTANDYQKSNNYYQQTKQTYYETQKPTPAPVEVKKIEQVNYNENRSFRQRPSSENSQVLESSTSNYSNKPNNSNYNNNNQNNYERSRQQNRRTQSNRQYSDNNNYSSTIRSVQPTERSFGNRGRGQQTYQNIRTTQKPSSIPEAYNQQTEKQVVQYTNGNSNSNKNYQQYNNQPTYNQQSYNQQSTQGFNNNNYRNENEQQTTYKIKYTSPITTQTTPQYSQQYDNNNNKQFSNPGNYEQFDKKSTTKISEKKLQYSVQTKQTTTGLENYNKNQASSSSQQTQASSSSQNTPAPKFNTNLLYDNNQQSTPDYYSQSNQQFKSNSNNVQSVNQQFAPVGSVLDYNQPQRKSTTFEQQPTVQPSTYNPGKNNYYNQPAYDKSKLQQHYSTTKTPSSVTYNQKYEPRSSTISYKNSDYDDGQYRPEFYEREAGGEYDVNSKQSVNKRVFVEQKEAPEQEFLKTAHSINIAASGNKLAKENQRLNAIAQTTSTKQQYYESRNNQNKNYNVPSSTISSTSVHYNENQYQNYHAPSTSAAPVKQFNYDDNQRNNKKYFSQSSSPAPSNVQYQVNAKSQPSSTAIPPFNNPQYSRNNQRHNYYSPSSTNQPEKQYLENKEIQKVNSFSQNTRQYTQDVTTSQPPRTQYTTASPRSVYSSFAAVTSEAPRPFSLRTDTPVVATQPKKHQVSKTSASSPAKPITSKSKDVSYDYAYYDTSDHYSEYENIEEFGRTSKKH